MGNAFPVPVGLGRQTPRPVIGALGNSVATSIYFQL